MFSLFEQRFNARAVPQLEREFGAAAVFIFEDCSELPLTGAMVDVEQMPADDSGHVAIEGRLTIATTTLTSNLVDTEILTSVRVREQLFHIYGKSPPYCGLTVFNIRRKVIEQDHTNMYDINDNQAVWHKP